MTNFPFQSDENLTISQLIRVFEKLNQQQNNPVDKERIDARKLHIIQIFETIIKKQMPLEYSLAAISKQENTLPIGQTGREVLYYFLLAFGVFQNAAGSYLFGESLFALIPGITNPVLVLASIVFTVLSGVLFYAFEVMLLKDALGIDHSSTSMSRLVETYSNQLNMTLSINRLLSTIYVLNIDPSLFDEFKQLAELVNQDLRNKHAAMPPYPTSLLRLILKVSVLAFGALSSISSSYYFANALLPLISASLVGSPIGWAIIAFTALAGLGFYYAMDAISMIRLVNPAFDEYRILKKELVLFERVCHLDKLNEVKSIKDQYVDRKFADHVYSSPGRAKLTYLGSLSANEDLATINTVERTRANSI